MTRSHKKTILHSQIAFFITEKSTSVFTPKADNTSAAPDFDDKARLPCLAMGIPHAAVTIEAPVEMFNVPDPSPPVPTMSIAFLGASM